jgi:hypothetical protein
MEHADVTFWLSVAGFAISSTLAIIKGFEFYIARCAARLAKIPLISIQTEYAESKDLYLPLDNSQIPGWDFYVHLEIENKFGVSCTIERVSGSGLSGATIRLHQPVMGGFKGFDKDKNPIDLIRDASSGKPIKPGGVSRLSFHLHVAKQYSPIEIANGVGVKLRFEFELHDQRPKQKTVVRRFTLKPGSILKERN